MNCSKACGPTNDSNPAAAVLASRCNCDSAAIVGAYTDVCIGAPTKGSTAFKKLVSDASNTDDVPARLSKNEFVMTADAVRAAGGGDINKGAKRMYETMNKLEARA